ncbi:MAG: hypothetical protein WAK53_02205 [Chromatiaceae bacterium]|jgi:hypothetical protein
MRRLSASSGAFGPAAFLLFAVTFLLVYDSNNVNAADQDEPRPLLEPCELISKVEAEEVMGTGLKEGQYSENKVVGQKLCLYEAADTGSFAFLQIGLTQDAFMAPKVLASGQSAKTIFSSIKHAFPDRERVDGLGDDAFLAIPGLHVLKGDYYLTVGAGNIKRNRLRLITAGEKAVANLEASL